MKYFSIDTVLKSFTNNVDSTSNKFWGVLAIISSLDKEVLPCTSYTFEVRKVSNLLERLFSLKDDKKNYSQPTEWGVIFSNKWTDYVSTELLNKTPNIYDIIGWYFRNVGFNDDVDNNELIKLFLESASTASRGHFRRNFRISPHICRIRRNRSAEVSLPLPSSISSSTTSL